MTGDLSNPEPQLMPKADDVDLKELENALDDEIGVFESVKDKDGNEQVVFKIAPVYFAQAFIKRYMPITYAGTTYIWNPNTLTFTVESGEIKSWIQKQIKRLVINHLLPATTRVDPITREIVSQVKGHKVANIDTYPFNMYNGFPVNNCVIVFDENGHYKTELHSPLMMYTRKSPWDFKPGADTAKAVNILKMWLGNDWEWLVQIPAQAIVQSLPNFDPFKQAYMLIGENDSGKSTYNGMLQCFFGKENVSTKTLQSFNEKFAKGDLLGKWMNFGDDLTSFKVEEGNEFKSIVGLPDTTVEQKFKDAFKARLTAVHAYSANALPELDKGMYGDIAWWSRWAIIEFNNHFERVPSWRIDNLTQDFYEGFMLLVIKKAGEIIKAKKLLLTQDWHEVKQKWIGSSSKLHEFIEMSIVTDAVGCVIGKQTLLDAIDTWVMEYMPVPSYLRDPEAALNWRKDQRQRLPDNVSMLTKALKVEGITTKQMTSNHDGERIWVYRDIAFKDVPWAKLPEYKGVGA